MTPEPEQAVPGYPAAWYADADGAPTERIGDPFTVHEGDVLTPPDAAGWLAVVWDGLLVMQPQPQPGAWVKANHLALGPHTRQWAVLHPDPAAQPVTWWGSYSGVGGRHAPNGPQWTAPLADPHNG